MFVLQTLLHLTNTPRLFQEFVLGAIAAMLGFPLSRKIVSVRETYVFGKAPERTMIPGPTGRATGYLFPSHDLGLWAKDIYQDIFSERFKTRLPKPKWARYVPEPVVLQGSRTWLLH